MHRRGKPGAHGSPGSGKGIPLSKGRTVSLIRQFESSRPARPSPLTASTIRDIPLDLLERIRAFPLFSSAPDSFLAAIGSYLRPQLFSPQEPIITEGEEAKALYFLVRGGVAVTSKDGESTFAELKPGAFFGEIAILMNMPRSARCVIIVHVLCHVSTNASLCYSVVARYKTLVVRLNKEDLSKILPDYPDVERTLREEAEERLAILYRRRYEKKNDALPLPPQPSVSRSSKRSRDVLDADTILQLTDSSDEELSEKMKKRKHPSPEFVEVTKTSTLSSGNLHIRQLLKRLPLFTDLPDDILHFLGLNAQPRTYPPFTNIVNQGTTGSEIFFITAGEVEVLIAPTPSKSLSARRPQNTVKARLGTGEFFGEVVPLSLSPKRTATVRSVVAVECLTIPGNVLDELWRRCPPDIRQKVEITAKDRLKQDPVVAMIDSDKSTLSFSGLALDEQTSPRQNRMPTKPGQTAPQAHVPGHEGADFDPFVYPERSSPRRHHLPKADPLSNTPMETSPLAEGSSPKSLYPKGGSPSSSMPPSRPISPGAAPKPFSHFRQPSAASKGDLPDSILVHIFEHLNLAEMMQCRQVSLHWSNLLSSSPDLLQVLDLSIFNRQITDYALVHYVCPFVGQRPRVVIINDCHHIGDEGFSALASQCGANARTWYMRSAWDISPNVVLELAEKVKGLVEIDLSNVRRISDNLLAYLVGAARSNPGSSNRMVPQHELRKGCPSLCRLKLSYCKGVSDRFMHMIAIFLAPRLQELDLTRCTAISDHGFKYWAQTPFPRLQKLVLADCTYLSDAAMLSLAQSARSLQELDLVNHTHNYSTYPCSFKTDTRITHHRVSAAL